MPRMTKYQAQEILRRIGYSAMPDFHSLPSDQVAQVLTEAETVLAARIRAENPGFTWGEAMRRAAIIKAEGGAA